MKTAIGMTLQKPRGNRIMNSLDKQGIADRTNRTYRTHRTYRVYSQIELIGPTGPPGPIGPISPIGPIGQGARILKCDRPGFLSGDGAAG